MKNIAGWWLPDDDTYFGPILITDGGFQIDRLLAALKLVKKFDVAVDGGAHIGTWTRVMSQWFRRVLAFEPAVETSECLDRNVQNCENVESYCSALGAKQGWCSTHDDTTRVGNTGSRFITTDNGGPIRVDTLDDDFKLDELDFLKLDVEGFEYHALCGAEKTIKRCHPVVMIEEKGFGERYALPVRAASKLLESWGATHALQLGKDHVYIF